MLSTTFMKSIQSAQLTKSQGVPYHTNHTLTPLKPTYPKKQTGKKNKTKQNKPNQTRIWLYKILQRINLIGIFLKTNKTTVAKCQLLNNKKSYQGRKNRKGLQEWVYLDTHTKCMAMVYLLVHTKIKEPCPHKTPFVPASTLLTCKSFPREVLWITFYLSINVSCRLILYLKPITEGELQRNSLLWTFLNLIITKLQN